MNPSHFPPSKSSFLKVQPHGFLLRGQALHSFDATIQNASLVRKKFQDKTLVCYSPDGFFSKTGLSCKDCPDDRGCRSRVRLLLSPSDPSLPDPLLLELPFSSARNFFHFEAHLHQAGLPLYQTLTRFAVVPRGSWGEVIFSIPSSQNSPLP